MSEPRQPHPDPRTGRLRVVRFDDPAGVLAQVEARPDAVEARFCPVAELERAAVAGYEVLLTMDGREPQSPHAWGRAMHAETGGRLQAALVRRALAERAALPPGAFLIVKVGAAAVRGEDLSGVLAECGSLEQVLIVVADESHAEHGGAVRDALAPARDAGARIGVDETGSGYASLRQLLAIRPDFVCIGGEFVVEVDRDPAKAAVVETLAALASRIGSRVIATGIPGRPELVALRRMQVPFGQGPMVGAPAASMEPLDPAAAEAIRAASPSLAVGGSVAALVEERPALPWASSLDVLADAFLEDPRHDVVVLVDERNRPLALAERAALLRGEPYERPVMRVTPTSSLKGVARRAAARPLMERFHPLVVCDRSGVYLGIVRVEQILDTLARED